jgi:gamma-glutamylcyclotransferase
MAPTVYFGYGSNLWLHQMSTRCPNSTYLGIARLNNYRWIINDRGYANVVELSKNSTSPSKYEDVVYGLVFSLSPTDELRLDKNEGVPVAYTKELLLVDFWPGTISKKIDTSNTPTSTKAMLVYIDRQRVRPDKPRKEYIYRMNQGISDAVKLGVPEGYVEGVMRAFIPAEEEDGSKEGEREKIAELARGQAKEFRDESGVFQ